MSFVVMLLFLIGKMELCPRVIYARSKKGAMAWHRHDPLIVDSFVHLFGRECQTVCGAVRADSRFLLPRFAPASE